MSKERLGGGWEFEKALFPLLPLNRSARPRVPVVQCGRAFGINRTQRTNRVEKSYHECEVRKIAWARGRQNMLTVRRL